MSLSDIANFALTLLSVPFIIALAYAAMLLVDALMWLTTRLLDWMVDEWDI